MQEEHDRALRSGAASSAPLEPEASGGSAAGAISVMIACERRPLHASLLSMLACRSGIEIKVGPGMDPDGLANCIEHHLPRVLMLDRPLLDRLDPQSLRRIHLQYEHVRVLLLVDDIRQGLVADVLRHRFHGFLSSTSPPEVCLKAIRAVSDGELWLSRGSLALAIGDLLGLSDRGGHGGSAGAPRIGPFQTLTPRESQVVALLRRGCINKEIARELGIKEDTVKKHLQSVFAKLGVHRRALVALRRLPGCSATHSIP